MNQDSITSGVSVIICCYNSATRLTPTLEHLARQKGIDPQTTEIILVDNNSVDETVTHAAECWLRLGSNVQLRVVSETRQGLSYARERGFKEAKFETVVFCDDDNWLNDFFLAEAISLFKLHSDATVLGGPIFPKFESDPPAWLNDYLPFYAIGSFPECGDITQSRAYVPGAGMVIRKSSYFKLRSTGFSFFCSDRKGQKLSSGGDTELCYALVLNGGSVYNSEKLSLFHFVPSNRMTWEYLSRLLAAIAAATVILNVYKREILNQRNDRSVLRKLVMESFRYVLNPLQYRNYRKTKAVGNRHQLGYENAAATLKECLRLLFVGNTFSRLKRQLRNIKS